MGFENAIDYLLGFFFLAELGFDESCSVSLVVNRCSDFGYLRFGSTVFLGPKFSYAKLNCVLG